MIVFGIRYRAGSTTPRDRDVAAAQARARRRVELAWTLTPLLLFLGAFAWGARLYLLRAQAPAAATEVFVVAKQWMWKLQHPDGAREIDELHVPVGHPGQARDDFAGRHPQLLRAGVPAQAGRASRPLYGAVVHADRVGRLPPVLRRVLRDRARAHGRRHRRARARRLRAMAGRATARTDHGRSAATRCFATSAAAAAMAESPRCAHRPRRACSANPVPLADGRTLVADERYLRDSILLPPRRSSRATSPIMPSFAGQIRRRRHPGAHRLSQEPRARERPR